MSFSFYFGSVLLLLMYTLTYEYAGAIEILQTLSSTGVEITLQMAAYILPL